MRDATPPDVLERNDVYRPAEDSWLLLRAMAADGVAGARALDVGTGTGIAACWMAREGATRVLAVDVNPSACALARANAARLGVANRVDVARADLFGAVRPGALFDVVAFNAPYLPTDEDEHVAGELDRAFHGGEAGVEVAVAFVHGLASRLAPRGRAYLVLSDLGDLGAVRAAANDRGLAWAEVARESLFFERVIVARLGLDA